MQIKEDNNMKCESIGGFNSNTNIEVITANNNNVINEENIDYEWFASRKELIRKIKPRNE